MCVCVCVCVFGGVGEGGRGKLIFYLVHPHGERVPVCDKEPLSDVKLGVKEKQRSLNVLLYDPLALLLHHRTGHQFKNRLQTIHAHNTYTTGKISH